MAFIFKFLFEQGPLVVVHCVEQQWQCISMVAALRGDDCGAGGL